MKRNLSDLSWGYQIETPDKRHSLAEPLYSFARQALKLHPTPFESFSPKLLE